MRTKSNKLFELSDSSLQYYVLFNLLSRHTEHSSIFLEYQFQSMTPESNLSFEYLHARVGRAVILLSPLIRAMH